METPKSGELPIVTIQLPVYNEVYVVERLLENISRLSYPKEKFEIQVLDDSTDDTVNLVADKVNQLKKEGLEVHHIHRTHRTGFKAGALQNGLQYAKGDLIAIFDSDFLPESDFLLKTIIYFQDPEIGVVQTRWGHINKEYSLLTRLQAFALDAHFFVEQSGRSYAKSFINFNGTGGIWRKEAILDAGGWSADTLTEDLDLSYRAQMRGWKFKYLEDVVAPAELPIFMPAIKSQQFRWNKGAVETAKKNLDKVLRSGYPISTKIHAFFHLLNSSVFLCLLISGIVSIPILFIKEYNPLFEILSRLGSFFLLGFFSITFFYWIATKKSYPENSFLYFIKLFPLFLILSMGLSFHNAYAVIEGLFGYKSPFIRTPKFNISRNNGNLKGNLYSKSEFSYITLAEGILFLYFAFGVASGIILQDHGFLIFHLMFSIGFAAVFFYSIIPVVNDRK
jgi:cellulose synthase/poly-beta-1,6-N-acetylglucosamine synthase-like glycosyltransferase